MAYDRDDYGRNREIYRGQDRGRYGQDGGRSGSGSRGDDDRGFLDRAGDEVRSWFGDDEAERRRERDDREQGYGQSYGQDRDRGWSGDRNVRSGGTGYTGAGGYGENYGRRQSSGRNEDNSFFGGSSHDGGSSYGREFQGSGQGDAREGYGQYGQRGSQHHDDPHYQSWRRQQIESLDRDYDEYRQQNQQRFSSEFGSWRTQRSTQRQSLDKVEEHMEVVGSDDQHVGTVDKVRGDRIILTKSDPDAGGHHHSIPSAWIQSVDDKVRISKSADEAKRAWRDEERNSAMFGGQSNQSNDGAHMLNRSFSGTY